jgi:hypothetical protein
VNHLFFAIALDFESDGRDDRRSEDDHECHGQKQRQQDPSALAVTAASSSYATPRWRMQSHKIKKLSNREISQFGNALKPSNVQLPNYQITEFVSTPESAE